MSLLMDALKRADSSQTDFSLAPLDSQPNNLTAKPLPTLARPIDSVNADFAADISGAAASSSPVIPAEHSDDEGRAAIRNAFTAKSPAAAKSKPLLIFLALSSLAAIGIGIYFWLQLPGMVQQTQAAGSSQTNADSLPPPPHGAPTTSVFAPNPGLTANNTEAPPPPTIASAAPVHRPTPPRDAGPSEDHQDFLASPIHLAITSPEPDRNLLRGYRNLQRNSLVQARQDYEQALHNEPNNIDTLLGLAAIAQREGRPTDAERYRQRALAADPRDPAAQAAVLGTSAGNPIEIESRLKNMLAAQPESAPLNFALGNLYARQARWNEAQQGYFNAVAGDTENPDYLFNLAVSLDQMHQPRLAAQHYQMALDAAERRPAAFERERVGQRMKQLAP